MGQEKTEKSKMSHNKSESKSWKETNKIRKAERKKWKQEKALKKLEKAKLEAAAKEALANKEKQVEEKPKEVSTLSMAVPGSILDNAQSAELRTYLAGQIARAACIFQVDEIVVFDDTNSSASLRKNAFDDSHGVKVSKQCCVQLGRILQYLECPQYLRKHFFPIHKDLRFAGILNPLDAPHHLREHNNFTFREGVVANKPVKNGRGSLINVGLKQDVYVDKLVEPGMRCTVKLQTLPDGCKKLRGNIVSQLAPRLETGVYWGYSVRIANSLSEVFTQSPYKDGYDLTIGTSDKGDSVDGYSSPKYNHALVVFGGLSGLEAALESDEVLNAEDPALLFDSYLNTLPDQGSRTIRTEEAILVTMAALRSKLNPNQRPMPFKCHEEIAQSSEKPQAQQQSSNRLMTRVVAEGASPGRSSSDGEGQEGGRDEDDLSRFD